MFINRSEIYSVINFLRGTNLERNTAGWVD